MDVYEVGKIARYLREALETDSFLGDLWVSGELSNVTRSAAGHIYFTLKDGGGQLRSVMFRSSVQPGVTAADGVAVVAHGRTSFYEQRGDLQFIVDVLMPHGMGALHLEFQRLRVKLEEEGLFDPSRKRALPAFPHRIGVVTSAAGSVLHDILQITRRRYPLAQVVVAPVPVQGETAAPAIVDAFRLLGRLGDLDVIILARGGGSLEELWPFNEEAVARAIYASHVPVVSAVGHETDVTIADLVADLRAPTPSAAAELATPNRDELVQRVRLLSLRAAGSLDDQVRYARAGVIDWTRRVNRALPPIAQHRRRIDDLTQWALARVQTRMTAERASVNRHIATLEALDPVRTLERGYAIVRRSDGSVIRSAADPQPGDQLEVRVADGAFPAIAGAPTSLVQPTPAPLPAPSPAVAAPKRKVATTLSRRGDTAPADQLALL